MLTLRNPCYPAALTPSRRFRFPKGKPLEAHAGELLDMLQDFEAGLGAEGTLSKAA